MTSTPPVMTRELVRPYHLLGQDEYWMTKVDDGPAQPIAVDDMTLDHCRRVLAWLRGNAEVMWAHERRTVAGLWRSRTITEDEYLQRMRDLDRISPAEWLEDTAMVRRLVQLVPRDPRPPRRSRLLPARFRLGGRA